MLHRKTPPPAQRWREEQKRGGGLPPPPARFKSPSDGEFITVSISRSLWEQFLKDQSMSNTNKNEPTPTALAAGLAAAVTETSGQPTTAAPTAAAEPVNLLGEKVDPVLYNTLMADFNRRVDARLAEMAGAPERGSLKDLWDGFTPYEKGAAIAAGTLIVGGVLYAVFRK